MTIPLLILGSLLTSFVVSTEDESIVLARVASGLERPVAIVSRPDDPHLYVVEQPGRIVALNLPLHGSHVVLDIESRVHCCGERGLLGVAISPVIDDRIFVNYTRAPDGATIVSSFRFGDGLADPSSESVILEISQPFSNHNGGSIAFGPDGYLWIGMGDGGSGGDPLGHGQNRATLLGAMLRIDVRGEPYAIPPGNLFVVSPDARPEIWSYGLRNPWKFSFDRLTGDLYIADVGQGDVEEIDFESRESTGGLNYGWNVLEGDDCFSPSTGCDRTGMTAPVITYRHDEGCSVTGGYVYRGERLESLQGRYVFGDYCSGTIWQSSQETGWDRQTLLRTSFAISTFGEDNDGELYVADHFDGVIYRFESSEPSRRRGAVRR